MKSPFINIMGNDVLSKNTFERWAFFIAAYIFLGASAAEQLFETTAELLSCLDSFVFIAFLFNELMLYWSSIFPLFMSFTCAKIGTVLCNNGALNSEWVQDLVHSLKPSNKLFFCNWPLIEIQCLNILKISSKIQLTAHLIKSTVPCLNNLLDVQLLKIISNNSYQ